jgi:hypothetical protein
MLLMVQLDTAKGRRMPTPLDGELMDALPVSLAELLRGPLEPEARRRQA